MSYPYRLTVAVPEALIAHATAMGACLAAQPQDAWKFTAATWLDGQGNRYAVASGVVGEGVVVAWQAPMQAPGFAPDTDTDAASMAQAAAILTGAPQNPPPATPGSIAAYLAPNGSSATDALAAMGLSQMPPDFP